MWFIRFVWYNFMIKAKFKFHFLIHLLLTALVVSSCTNVAPYKGGAVSTNPSYLINTTTYSHYLNTFTANAITSSGSTGSGYEFALGVDASQITYTSLLGFCSTTDTTKVCNCTFTWNEINTTGGTSTTISRKKLVTPVSIQAGTIKCDDTSSTLFWDEIPATTAITVNIEGDANNTSGLYVKPIIYTKGTSSTTATGDFEDSALNVFRNIFRYSCYSKRYTSAGILNNSQSVSVTVGSNTSSTNVPMASMFCTGASAPSGTPFPGAATATVATCTANPTSTYSAQSYYRNLYIPSANLSVINSTNADYDCPKVTESLLYSAGQTNANITAGKYWPLDTSFALSVAQTTDYSVGVRAASMLYKAGDPNSDPSITPSFCKDELSPNKPNRLAEKAIYTACMGYAKKPNADGTCGTITDSNGKTRPLTRLRRFRVVYPSSFQQNGIVDTGSPEADEVYVADRLVVDSNGIPTGAMIYGPKPCNFAWFDHEGVVNRNLPTSITPSYNTSLPSVWQTIAGVPTPVSNPQPGYVATSNYKYTAPVASFGAGVSWSVNPDGLIFPNVDRAGVFNGNPNLSCSAALPVVNQPLGGTLTMNLATTNVSRLDYLTRGSRKIYLEEVHIQPVDPWTPNYVEDISFQACAPLADPYLEAPMHFYKKDANTMAWCSEPYPTQNPYWAKLNANHKTTNATWQTIDVNSPTNPAAAGTTSFVTADQGTSYARVVPYTSHNIPAAAAGLDTKNSCLGTQAAFLCTAATGSANNDCTTYLGNLTRKTCDRTVVYDATNPFYDFPLQAADADITTMLTNDLNNDKTFGCEYSVNPSDPTKVGTKVPSSGCCGGSVGAIMSSPATPNGYSGHLEPYLNPAAPTVRFCGNPVQ
jgi:hypothetical protein